MVVTAEESSTKSLWKENVKEQVHKVCDYARTSKNDQDVFQKNNNSPWNLSHANPLLIETQ